MDILNKAGAFQDSSGVYPSASKPVSAPSTVQPATQIKKANSTNPDLPGVSNNVDANSNQVEIRSTINSLNASVQNIQRGIEFSVDEESGRSVVKVVDRETGDVIRQLPAEDALAISRQIKEYVEARQTEGNAAGQSDGALGFIMQVQA